MGAAFFYHLTRSTLEEALPPLLNAAGGKGWRVALRGRSEALLARLDQRLWTHPPESFLPHGRAGGPHDAEQPILLTDKPDIPNGAACLMAVEGAEVSAEEVAALERTCILFDGHDPAALEAARGQWRALTGAGAAAKYWAQGERGWEMKAEAGGGAGGGATG